MSTYEMKVNQMETLTQSHTILVVEDQAEFQEVVRIYLERAGLKALTASNGSEALEVFQAHKREIDLVLCDVSLPGISGIDLSLELRRRKPGLKVIIMTGNTYLDQNLRSGVFHDFLPKPFPFYDLLTAVHSALDVPKAA